MAHYDYEWSLTPHRAQSCDTEWLLLDVFFSFLAPSGAQEVKMFDSLVSPF